MPDPFAHPPLESVIAAAVALVDALRQSQLPQDRHHARVISLRATSAGFDDVATNAQNLADALSRAVRPQHSDWAAALERLQRAIDRALDAPDDE
mgnify:CR=1 FL=1